MRKGYIHSIQSLGAVDGPGVRSVVFMQGCALRCGYCHNPDTWQLWGSASEMQVQELVDKLLRFRFYYGKEGGVTISGGEPLLQKEFVAEAFKSLQEHKVHTALDTAGQIMDEGVKKLLEYTDLALVDLKFATEQEYQAHAQGSLKKVLEFLDVTKEMQVPIWIRHVMVPGLTADVEYLKKIQKLAEGYENLEKIEWLPFHNLCMEKYDKLKIPFPMKDVRVMDAKETEALLLAMRASGRDCREMKQRNRILYQSFD